ncbi:MAG TPA: type II toxin-antitoxin system HicB family antitoxin [Pseudonocardiaceae bacterium]
MSETYTAVYERDGDAWFAEIAEEPGVRSQGSNVAQVRADIRDALARQLDADPGELHIVDDFRMPAQVRAAQKSVQATRTEDQRAKIMASMTDSRSAMEWAEELGTSMRDPVTVEWLKSMGDKQVSIDTFCHTITMMEDLSRLSEEERSAASKDVLKGL